MGDMLARKPLPNLVKLRVRIAPESASWTVTAE